MNTYLIEHAQKGADFTHLVIRLKIGIITDMEKRFLDMDARPRHDTSTYFDEMLGCSPKQVR